jgi:hypothetical protein
MTYPRRRRGFAPAAVVSLLGSWSCGGQQEEPQFPPVEESPAVEEAPDEDWDTGERSAEPVNDNAKHNESEEPKQPEFKAGMSVNDAIAAVPSHYDYIGLDEDVLAKPLRNLDTYKPCNVTQSHHFTVRIAVWDGDVVGADVKAPNKTLAECIDQVVRNLKYKEKAESINTVEYSF